MVGCHRAGTAPNNGEKRMRFFREAQPDIFIATGSLQTESDGADWTKEYDALLARGRPFFVIANVRDRPQPPAGKPMVLWMKARKAKLAELVKLTIYIAEDDGARRTRAESPRETQKFALSDSDGRQRSRCDRKSARSLHGISAR